MSPDTAPPSSATPEKQALLEAFDTVLKTQAEQREAERAAAERRRGPSRVVILACLLAILVCVTYVSVERPAWVFPPPPTPESTAMREASLRITLANAAQHVDRFHERMGRLPRTLEEAGTEGTGLTLESTASGYRLQGRSGDVTLALTSGEPLAAFLGNSFDVISRRSR